MMPVLEPKAWLWDGLMPSAQISEPKDLMHKNWKPLYIPEDIKAAYRAGVAAGVRAERDRRNRLEQ